MDVKTSVDGIAINEMRKFLFSSATLPCVVPLTMSAAQGTVSLENTLRIVLFRVICAKENTGKKAEEDKAEVMHQQ
jgi:hypothetical protein